MAPCLLPELSLLSRLRLCSRRYYPLDLDLVTHPHLLSLFQGPHRRLLVQRKPGHLPYHIDPHALSSLLVRPFHPPSDDDTDEEGGREQHVISAFSTDPYLRSLARHEYCPDGSDPGFLTGVLYECLSKHKPQLLHLHLGLAAQCRGLPTMPTHQQACTVRLGTKG